jgi:hypothetical protein
MKLPPQGKVNTIRSGHFWTPPTELYIFPHLSGLYTMNSTYTLRGYHLDITWVEVGQIS